MTLGVVFFCTKYRSSLKYPVKHTYHHLLVKLRGLLQHCRAMEIIQFKKVCSTLCTLSSDLRGVDLGKSLLIQEITEPFHNTFLNLEFGTLSYISQ